MKVLLVPIGSAGDVYPFAGVGVELRRRGHHVTLITNGYFESLARRLGFDFAPFGTAEQFRTAIQNPNIWHSTRGFQTIVNFFIEQRGLYEQIVQRNVPGQTVVVGHSLAFATRIAQEKHGIPAVTLTPAPALIRSAYEVPTMIGRLNFSRTPRWFKRFSWWATDWLLIDRLMAGPINQLRAEVGLPPVRRILHHWFHSSLLSIGLFPAWFCPPQPDWPRQFRLTGFPLFDTEGATRLAEDVEQFLAAGTPPVVFTPGSANAQARAFFEAAVGACLKLNRRGLLLTRFAEQIPVDLPGSVRHFNFAPLSQLLPRCAALAHHGGIGTTAAAMAAGIPQIIMPMSHDQPDNAARVVRLGVGARIPRRRFVATVVSKELGGLLESGAVREKCQHVATLCRKLDAISETCDLIESAMHPAAAETTIHTS